MMRLTLRSESGTLKNKPCVVFGWIFRALCFPNMKMCFCILPLVGVLFMCWYFPVMISGDWNGTFQSDSFWSGLVAEIGTAPSCSLRYTAKKDISLRKYFKFSVPVFQWAESFTPSEWEKLQNDSPPYGWKGQTPHEVNGTLSLLWHPSNGRLFKRNASDHCVRCAVVGNGGILRGSRQGKAIDDHDYVFRVNGAIIKGFEKDVGSKTSFYGFTTNSMKNSLSTYEEDGFNMVPHDEGISYIFIPAEIRDYMMLASAIHGVPVPTGFDKDDWPSKYFGDESKVHQFKMLHPLFIQYVTQTFLNSPLMKDYKDIYMPSTGALMLLTALHTCDQVSAYGFITKNYNEFSDHYYDKEMKPLVFYANHDMEMEGLLWELLHSHRVLQLYQRYTKQI